MGEVRTGVWRASPTHRDGDQGCSGTNVSNTAWRLARPGFALARGKF